MNVYLNKYLKTQYIWQWAAQVAQRVKNPPTNERGMVQSLCSKDPLEKEMATPSSILAWRIPWTEEPGGKRIGYNFEQQHTWQQ